MVRDPTGVNKDKAFYTTVSNSKPKEILQNYARRWSIEVAFENAKSHFGFEDSQNRTEKAVERTAPLSGLLYSLIILWFDKHGHKKCHFPKRPWYERKTTPSFVDILNTLKAESLREYFRTLPGPGRGRKKLLDVVNTALGLVA